MVAPALRLLAQAPLGNGGRDCVDIGNEVLQPDDSTAPELLGLLLDGDELDLLWLLRPLPLHGEKARAGRGGAPGVGRSHRGGEGRGRGRGTAVPTIVLLRLADTEASRRRHAAVGPLSGPALPRAV